MYTPFKNHFVSPHQLSKIPRNAYEHQTIVTVSQSLPIIGSYFVIDLKQKNLKLHELMLEFNVSSNFILTPAWFWIDHVEILINGVIVDTIYQQSNFILSQYFSSDQERLLKNSATGAYNNTAELAALWGANDGSTRTNVIELPLKTLCDQSSFDILNQNHELQLKIYLSDIGSWTSSENGYYNYTASTVINSCNLICKATKIE